VQQSVPERLEPKALDWREGTAVFGVTSGALLGLEILALLRGHPEEDAYIMFRYAEHLARGLGIVFNPAGPRAEGATDFLWMLLLAGFNAVGVDVALAAVLLNALGAGITGLVLAKAIDHARVLPSVRRLWLGLATASVPLLSAAMAAYGGFSSMLYVAISLAALHLSLRGSARALSWLPALLLALALFRPDGVVLGIPIALLSALRARRLGVLRELVLGSCAAALAGVAYFLWRYEYFGLLLPLPLYVKSRVGDIDKLAELPAAVRTYVSAWDPRAHEFRVGHGQDAGFARARTRCRGLRRSPDSAVASRRFLAASEVRLACGA